MGPPTPQSNWSDGYNNCLLCKKASSPSASFGYHPMLLGSIKSRFGLVFCSASACSQITSRVSKPWNTLLQTLLPITIKRQSPSNGSIPLTNWRKNLKRGKESNKISKLLKSSAGNSDRTSV